MHLIRHEHAHLAAFKELCDAEGITEEVCLKLGETFDAAMTDEAWARLSHALDEMRKDYGDENEIVKICRKIEDQAEVEDVTQMKGALKAIVHPTGQMYSLFSPLPFTHPMLGDVHKKKQERLTQRIKMALQIHPRPRPHPPRNPQPHPLLPHPRHQRLRARLHGLHNRHHAPGHPARKDSRPCHVPLGLAPTPRVRATHLTAARRHCSHQGAAGAFEKDRGAAVGWNDKCNVFHFLFFFPFPSFTYLTLPCFFSCLPFLLTLSLVFFLVCKREICWLTDEKKKS